MAEDDGTDNTDPGRPAKVKRLPPIIQPDEVREIFRGVLRGSDRLPDAEACLTAAHMISSAARWHRFEVFAPNERRDALAMRRLVTDLNRRLAAEAKRVDAIFDSRNNIPEVQQKLDRIRSDLIARIRAAQSALVQLRPVYEAQIWPKRTWKDAALELWSIFEITMRSVDPSKRFGHSLGGPVVRFVHATLPRIVGEEITEGAIAREFKRAHKAGTKAAVPSVPVHLH
jgi:hypothetical protein